MQCPDSVIPPFSNIIINNKSVFYPFIIFSNKSKCVNYNSNTVLYITDSANYVPFPALELY